MPQTVSVGELTDLVVQVFLRYGVSRENAGPVAETVGAAECDGASSHGLLRLPGYVSTVKSGWVDGRAVPVVADAVPGLVATEASNGFAQPALRVSGPLLREKARRQGIATVAIRNSHHFTALWPDIQRGFPVARSDSSILPAVLLPASPALSPCRRLFGVGV